MRHLLSFVLAITLCRCYEYSLTLFQIGHNDQNRLRRDVKNPINITLRDNYDVRYIGQIFVGTPPQSQFLIFDTGSSLTWFPEYMCQTTGFARIACENPLKTYDPGNSTTSRLFSRNGVNISYALGTASGDLRKDTITFGEDSDAQLKDMVFGSMQRVHNVDYGILGLSPRRPDMPYGNFFYEMVEQKLVSLPVYTLFLKSCKEQSCANGGRITFGALDDNHCERHIVWVNNIGDRHWKFELDGISVGNTVVSGKFDAVTDSGFSYTQLTHDVFMRFREAAGIAMVKHDKEPTTFETPCTNRFNVTITISGEPIVIPGNVFMKPLNGEICEVTIMEGNRDYFILGQAFLRGVCNVHDVWGNRLGFSLVEKIHIES